MAARSHFCLNYKDFWAVFCTGKSVPVSISLWRAPRPWEPDGVLFSQGVHRHPSWVNMLLVWPRLWTVRALATTSFSQQVWCHPALAWDSAVLFIFGFNGSDFSEPRLGRGGLAPWTGVKEHLCRCLAKVLLSEDTLVFCLGWMGSRGLHISWAHALPPNLGQNS